MCVTWLGTDNRIHQRYLTVGFSYECDAIRELFCRLWRGWHPGNKAEPERILGVNLGEDMT